MSAFWITAGLSVGSILVATFAFLQAAAVPVAERSNWPAEWDKTLKVAKEEGRVTIYHFGGATSLPIEAGVFQKRFPEIKVLTVSGDPVPRILAERRAGKYIADIAIGGSTTPWQLYRAKALDPIKDTFLWAELLDESKWWGGKHHYTDPEQRYAFSFIGNPQMGSIFYNTKLIDPKEIQSFWDFLNPRWKGKMLVRDIRSPGTGTTVIKMFYYNPKIGAEFIRRLFTEMEITLFRDRRQSVDWLATGKYPICFFCQNSDVGRAKAQGLPVDEFGAMKEGVGISSSSGNIGFVNRAPHPNAAKVYINWLLSREGQITVQTEYVKAMVGTSNSRRIDIPKEMLPPRERLVDGVNYIEVETPERMQSEPILKVVNEALSEAAK